MVDFVTFRALAEEANRPMPTPDDAVRAEGLYEWSRAWDAWAKAREAYIAAISDPAVTLALLAVAEAARVWREGKMGVRKTTRAIMDVAELLRDSERNRRLDRAHDAAHEVLTDASDRLIAALDALTALTEGGPDRH